MARLGLQQEEQVSIFLCLFVVWEIPLLKLGGVVEVVLYFFALYQHIISMFHIETVEPDSRGIVVDIPPQAPCGSGSAAQCASRDSVHPSRGRSSSLTETKSWPLDLAASSVLLDCKHVVVLFHDWGNRR